MSGRGGWLQTYTGRVFYPADPRADEVCIEDIAHALSLLCRFGGHCERFYSVAEHSVLCSYMVPPEAAFDALMHDATEAYLVDLPSPVKHSLPEYKSMEEVLWCVILERFPQLAVVTPRSVRQADRDILFSERDQNLKPNPIPWNLEDPGTRINLYFWSPSEAETKFLERFHHLSR